MTNSSINLSDQSDLYNSGIVKRIMSLPFGIRLKLLSTQSSQKIQLIGQKYGFELLRLANITRLIREYYFGEVRFENFPAEIEKRMGVSLLTAQEITRYIKQEIIDWDPWAEYIAGLPKMTVREIVQNHPKIAAQEITKGFVELRDSEDLENPTIKNWVKDYVSHLGYERHSQMQRMQYMFHSENGRDLDSQDREKLGIILKSFDENIALPVDEENEEIILDGLIDEKPKASNEQRSAINSFLPTPAPKPQPIRAEVPTDRQESFIKPYNPTQPQPKQETSPRISPQRKEVVARPQIQIQRPTVSPVQPQKIAPPMPAPQKQPTPTSPQPSSLHIGRQAYKEETDVHPNMISQPSRQFFSATRNYTESPAPAEIPGIKIHSITERNNTKADLPKPPRIVPPQPNEEEKPRHLIINPFSGTTPEPRIEGNVVDLSGE